MSDRLDEVVEAMAPIVFPQAWKAAERNQPRGSARYWQAAARERAAKALAALPAGFYRSDGQGKVDSPDPSHSWSWGALRASASDCERAGLIAAAQTLRDVSEALFPVLAALSSTDTEKAGE